MKLPIFLTNPHYYRPYIYASITLTYEHLYETARLCFIYQGRGEAPCCLYVLLSIQFVAMAMAGDLSQNTLNGDSKRLQVRQWLPSWNVLAALDQQCGVL